MSGLFITQNGVNVLTQNQNSATGFSVNTNFNNLKFVAYLTDTINVTDMAGANPETFVTHSISLPAVVSGIEPFYFSYITTTLGGADFDYVNEGIGGGVAYVSGNPSGGNLNTVLGYLPGGSTNYTATYRIYVFANGM